MKNFLKIGIVVFAISFASCKKDYLDTKPSNGIIETTIYSTTASLSSVLNGTYKSLFAFVSRHDRFGQKSVDLACDLAGADMVVHTAGYGWFNSNYQYTNWINSDATTAQPDQFWYYYYDIIKQANQIIAGLDNATGTIFEKESIKGQCLGLRAYAYYHLINLFQQTYKGNENKPGVPIYLTAQITGNPRGTVQNVYDRIIADLTAAETLLTGKTFTSKVAMSLQVVQGYRARVALVMEDWTNAATYAAKARIGSTLMTTTQYTATSAFSSIAGPECMWGSLIPASEATIYASFYSHVDVSTGGYAALGTQKKITKALYDLMPATDIRKSCFTLPTSTSTSNPAYNQIKMRVPTAGSWAADYTYMRASEMYLIEAEALSRKADDAGARTALQTLVVARNASYSAASLSGAALLSEILLQRRIELWGEGFSMIDIKRLKTGLNRLTGAGNNGSPSLDPIVYTMADADPRFILRLPKRELDNNTSMTPADQNP
jgi:hypothetical protein